MKARLVFAAALSGAAATLLAGCSIVDLYAPLAAAGYNQLVAPGIAVLPTEPLVVAVGDHGNHPVTNATVTFSQGSCTGGGSPLVTFDGSTATTATVTIPDAGPPPRSFYSLVPSRIQVSGSAGQVCQISATVSVPAPNGTLTQVPDDSAIFGITIHATGNGLTTNTPLTLTAVRRSSDSSDPTTVTPLLTEPVYTTFPYQPEVQVLDNAGNPVPGVSVTFTIAPNPGTASFAGGATYTTTTDAEGIAQANPIQAGTTPGDFTVTATVTSPTAASFSTGTSLVYHFRNSAGIVASNCQLVVGFFGTDGTQFSLRTSDSGPFTEQLPSAGTTGPLGPGGVSGSQHYPLISYLSISGPAGRVIGVPLVPRYFASNSISLSPFFDSLTCTTTKDTSGNTTTTAILSSQVVRSTNPAFPVSQNSGTLDLTISQTKAPNGSPISRQVQISDTDTGAAPKVYYAGPAAGRPVGAIGISVQPQSFVIVATPFD